MTSVSKGGASISPKTGFNPAGPFLNALYGWLPLGVRNFRLSLARLELTVGVSIPTKATATTSYGGGLSGGRVVRIVAVNGKQCDEQAAIDTGNGSFLSYGGFSSALSAATTFPFTVTFEGGDTLRFEAPPRVNGVATRAMAYSHNVLALGFMAPYSLTIDDQAKKIHFVAENDLNND